MHEEKIEKALFIAENGKSKDGKPFEISMEYVKEHFMKPLNFDSVNSVTVAKAEYYMFELEEEIDVDKIDAPEA